MKAKALSLALATLCISSGCSSLNGVVREGIHPRTGEPLYYSSQNGKTSRSIITDKYETEMIGKYGSRAEMIAQATTQEINLVYLKDNFPTVFPESSFNAEYYPTSDGARIDLNWTSQDCFFPLGIYDVNSVSTKNYNQREGVAFITLAQQTIESTISRLKENGMHSYRIQAKFSGKADGIPIRNLYYRGEYGAIRLIDNTTLNGISHEFHINPGQKLNNHELAALRAFSLAFYLHGKIADKNIEDHFDIQTINKADNKFRTASVSITILDE